jgi:hypothetical protein
MTGIQITAIGLLNGCTFQVGSFDKRFVRDLAALPDKETRELTEKQIHYLWKLVYKYRRQHGNKWFTAHAENLISNWEVKAIKELMPDRPKLKTNYE